MSFCILLKSFCINSYTKFPARQIVYIYMASFLVMRSLLAFKWGTTPKSSPKKGQLVIFLFFETMQLLLKLQLKKLYWFLLMYFQYRQRNCKRKGKACRGGPPNEKEFLQRNHSNTSPPKKRNHTQKAVSWLYPYTWNLSCNIAKNIF